MATEPWPLYILPGEEDAAKTLLKQSEVAERWRVSGRTLERWRANGTGPAWLVLEGSVRYRLSDVMAYETRHTRGPAA